MSRGDLRSPPDPKTYVTIVTQLLEDWKHKFSVKRYEITPNFK